MKYHTISFSIIQYHSVSSRIIQYLSISHLSTLVLRRILLICYRHRVRDLSVLSVQPSVDLAQHRRRRDREVGPARRRVAFVVVVVDLVLLFLVLLFLVLLVLVLLVLLLVTVLLIVIVIVVILIVIILLIVLLLLLVLLPLWSVLEAVSQYHFISFNIIQYHWILPFFCRRSVSCPSSWVGLQENERMPENHEV